MLNGIINVLKPPGMTSHDVVSFCRRTFGQKRVGHAGTLDPAAAGVLPVFFGQATRLIEYLAAADKCYRVELTFGFATDTGDDTGKVISRSDNAPPGRERLLALLARFTGAIDQIPPMYAAIKVGGRKLYELARDGIEVERQPRRVVIHSLELMAACGDVAVLDVICSKGTYIRSLCGDIGRAADCPAVMSFLVRTRVGQFTLSDAKTLEEIRAGGMTVMLPPDTAVSHLTTVTLSAAKTHAFITGQAVDWPQPPATDVARVYDPDGLLIGIGQHQPISQRLTPVKVFAGQRGPER
jgi:tRNA pseudouridine55 synthase